MLKRLAHYLHVRAYHYAMTHDPSIVIPSRANKPYLRRWHIVRNRFFAIYLHEFLSDDEDEALHDHPYLCNASFLLAGTYVEETVRKGGIHVKKTYEAGDIKFRGPTFAHRIELIDSQPCWSLFLCGPRVREWGFHCKRVGWVHWKVFNGSDSYETPRRGCGEID